MVGSSGGSGAQYGLRLIEVLLDAGHAVQWVVSGAGMRVLRYELGVPQTALVAVVPAFAVVYVEAGGSVSSDCGAFTDPCGTLEAGLSVARAAGPSPAVFVAAARERYL